MSNVYIVVGVIAVLLLGGIAYNSSINGKVAMEQNPASDTMMPDANKGAMMNGDTSSSNTKDEMMKGATSTSGGDIMAKVGSYVQYDTAKLSMAKDGHVVLFFRAAWCPTCRNVDNDIKSHLSSIPANLTILDVNYDDSKELKKKYGVTYQHTFVEVDAKGMMIKKWSGSPTLAALISEIK